ncbi:MAG: amino acid ABC transporter permease [Bacillota bacterium]|nr:amino acid ABC transporter permease [Bacillota bacterium]
MAEWFSNLKAQFILNFIDDNRWKLLVNGVLLTIRIAFFAVILGVLIGSIVAIIRSTYDKNQETMARRKGFLYYLFSFVNAICKVYLAIIRGTPVVVQLMIMYFIIFASSKNGMLVATLAFGINSGAYVAEILRGGILSIDNGQFEAGRSLGLNYVQTMIYIIIPQVFKNVLPTLLNEFIALLKETSVSGYVGIKDLTKGGDTIRGLTFAPFMPLIAVALLYLMIVLLLTWAAGKVERRLRTSEK